MSHPSPLTIALDQCNPGQTIFRLEQAIVALESLALLAAESSIACHQLTFLIEALVHEFQLAFDAIHKESVQLIRAAKEVEAQRASSV